MKLKIVFALFFISTLSVFSQEFSKPVDFLTFINKEQELIAKSTWKYTSAVAHSKSARRIDATRKQLIKSIQFFAAMHEVQLAEWCGGAKDYSEIKLQLEGLKLQYSRMFQ